jgi:hypothetical protein
MCSCVHPRQGGYYFTDIRDFLWERHATEGLHNAINCVRRESFFSKETWGFISAHRIPLQEIDSQWSAVRARRPFPQRAISQHSMSTCRLTCKSRPEVFRIQYSVSLWEQERYTYRYFRFSHWWCHRLDDQGIAVPYLAAQRPYTSFGVTQLSIHLVPALFRRG